MEEKTSNKFEELIVIRDRFGCLSSVCKLVRCKDCAKCTEMKVHKTYWCNGPKKGPTKSNGFCDEGVRT